MKAGPAVRYTIGEWFGRPAAGMDAEDRVRAAAMALGGEPAPQCPFDKPRQCKKAGGVCSLRPHTRGDGGGAVPAGEEVCAVCPRRLCEDDLVVRWVGEEVLGTTEPLTVREVDFLRTKDDKAAGRIDMVLCDPRTIDSGGGLQWCIVETQTVYFSGGKMDDEFVKIQHAKGSRIPFPAKARRPDFRSSGAKRLQPQLEAKCPTLARWGIKIAVVVDRPFFDSLSHMERALDNDDGEIIWFVVRYEPRGNRYALARDMVVPVTLDVARRGLQNADPVSKQAFESKLRAKLQAAGLAGSKGSGAVPGAAAQT